jgi:putative SOS response-associated peptidase YedK
VTAELDELVEVFDAPPLHGVDLGLPRYNVAPTQDAPIVAVGRNGRRIAGFRWGLVPFWADDPSIGNRMINARSESVATKPAFRRAFERRRCLVPADGFYEWQRPETGRGPKRPFWIHRPDERPFALAGLWERWGAEEDPLLSFTVLTTRANDWMRPIHDRMPVLLPRETWERWLDRDSDTSELADVLALPSEDALVAREVGTLVNSPSNDGPGCIEAVG